MALNHILLAATLVLTGIAPQPSLDSEFSDGFDLEETPHVESDDSSPENPAEPEEISHPALSEQHSEDSEEIVGFIIQFAQDAVTEAPDSEIEALETAQEIIELAPVGDLEFDIVDAVELDDDLYSVELTDSVSGDEAELLANALEESSVIEFVEFDYVIKLDPLEGGATVMGSTSVGSTATGMPWGLDRINQRSLPLDGVYNPLWSGAGVLAYVVDTGVMASHTEFGSRVVAGANFANDRASLSNTSDCNGHGTHVAGTLGGHSYGAAKNVTIVPVRVLDCAGAGTTSSVIAGLKWIEQNHNSRQKAVVNISLGGGRSVSLDDAVNALVARGIPVVVASGNEGRNSCDYSPARAASAITVNASTQSDGRASFSNFGSCSDVYAPGSQVLSAWWTNNDAIVSLSGTSMAAPHVAGVVAQMLEANPLLSAPQVKSLIRDRSTQIGFYGKSGDPNGLVFSGNFLVKTPSPEIKGVARVGNVVTVVDGEWDAGAVLSHQWFSGGTPIAGQTNSTLELRPEHLGKAILVRTTGSKPGFAPTVKSSSQLQVQPGIFDVKPIPVVMGSAPLGIRSPEVVSEGSPVVVGQVLQVIAESWSPEASMSYQWFSDGRAIKKATRASYVVSSKDAGKKISVRVTGSRPGYETVTYVLGHTSPVLRTWPSPIPSINGTASDGLRAASVGEVLSASVPEELTSVATVSYQWLANGKAIKRATGQTYVVTSKDAGKRISVRVTGTRSGFTAVTLTSVATDPVTG